MAHFRSHGAAAAEVASGIVVADTIVAAIAGADIAEAIAGVGITVAIVGADTAVMDGAQATDVVATSSRKAIESGAIADPILISQTTSN